MIVYHKYIGHNILYKTICFIQTIIRALDLYMYIIKNICTKIYLLHNTFLSHGLHSEKIGSIIAQQ